MNSTCDRSSSHVEVVVAERRVLRRVEHLEQGRGRVAPPVGAELVDLVEQDDRVHRAGVAQGADQAARQRADVGAPVAADLGLVAHAAEAHAHELAAERAGDGLAERRLADAGRPDQRQDHAAALVLDLALAPELAHGEVLEDALLDLLRPAWSASSDLPRGVHVDAARRSDAPRHVEQPVEVGADRRRLGPLLPPALEPVELALGLLAGLLRAAGLGDAVAVALDLVAVLAVSPSSLRIASSWRRSRNSRWLFSMPSVTSSRMRRRSSISPSASRAQPIAFSRRSSTSSVSSSSSLRSSCRSGRVAGGVGQRAGLRRSERRNAATPGLPRASRISSRTARYSRASSCARSSDIVGDRAARRPRCGARRPAASARPSSARCRARMRDAAVRPGQHGGWPSSSATTPMRAKRPSWRGTSTTWPVGALARERLVHGRWPRRGEIERRAPCPGRTTASSSGMSGSEELTGEDFPSR